MATFHCRVDATTAATAILQYLDAIGVVTADHTVVADGQYSLTLTDAEIKTVEDHGLKVKRGEMLRTRNDRSDVGNADGPAVDLLTGFVTGYMDAVQVASRITSIAAAFPALCTVINLPWATSGYDGALPGASGPATVRGLRITDNPGIRSRPGFLLIGGTHAREWMNPIIALEFAEQLLHNVDPASVDPEVMATTRLVTEGDILIVPVMNPDGLTFSIHDDAGWRKNRRPNAGSPACPGVDNNRNYEVYFGGAGSSASPCAESFRGGSALSESEGKNIRWLLEEFPNILVGVDAHSFGQQILRPGPAGGSFISSLPVSAEDDAIYTGLETTLRNAIAAVNGNTYSVGSTSNHAGTSDEYMFFAHRVFGFNTECGTSFQPAWAAAVPVINEVVTGLRALAVATLDLVLTTPTPLRLVQCIDRTGSMIAFGYDGAARSNAKRFVDLMSLGDSTGIVSFADPSPDPAATPVANRSREEFPLTLLDDPGDAAVARAAIDAISFGGWTPIGAGLQRSASMLTGSAAPRAILLISDGYENRDPTVSSVLSTWPTDLRVFTIALGPAADAMLLQQIATQTGGIFQSSPTALDLHLIYNQMRADITDEGLAMNDAIPAGEEEYEDSALIEPGADWLTIGVSTIDRLSPSTTILSPSGRIVSAKDFGVRVVHGEGYTFCRIARPSPGRWRICTRKMRSAGAIAAFVSSPLRVNVMFPRRQKSNAELVTDIRALFGRVQIAAPRSSIKMSTIPHMALPKEKIQSATAGWADSLPREALASIADRVKPVHQSGCTAGKLRVRRGTSRLDLKISGELPGGAPFQRVITRTLCLA
ncbi:MAG: M14 family zinc carboxypeptidase [Acidobacteriota bacterium]